MTIFSWHVDDGDLLFFVDLRLMFDDADEVDNDEGSSGNGEIGSSVKMSGWMYESVKSWGIKLMILELDIGDWMWIN